jgi:hypothetical protein
MIIEALTNHQSSIWTALPAIVQSYNAAKGTVEAYCALKFERRQEDGTYAVITPQPLFVDCPVLFPGGGGFTLTFPILPGDEVLMIFASRCIDAWWDMSGVQKQSEFRMHDMSDGFALVGPRSRPRALAAASTNGVELRADDRSSYIRIGPSGAILVHSSGTVGVEAPTINLTGTVNITGDVNITGVVHNNSKLVGSGIKVTGVVAGGGQSTGVV